MPTILGISGSLRKGSNSTAILRTLAERDWVGAHFEIFDLKDIPLYNGDLDVDPAAVVALKRAIADCDGLVLVSPEYNYGIPGVLKNALDWASRPGYKSVLKDKPVVCLTSSPGLTGGVRAHSQLRQTLYATLAQLVPVPEVAIPSVTDKIVEGRLTDERSLKMVTGLVDALIAWVNETNPSSC